MTQAPTFIERHGLVPYGSHLGTVYPRPGECEVGACLEREAARIARGRARQAEILRELEALEAAREGLTARHGRLLAWAPRLARTRERRRLELARARRLLRANAAELAELREVALPMVTSMLTPDPRRPLLFDHCHRHGWVRGLVCDGCNVRLALADTRRLPLAELMRAGDGAALVAHLAKCPDCPPYPPAPARRGSAGFWASGGRIPAA